MPDPTRGELPPVRTGIHPGSLLTWSAVAGAVFIAEYLVYHSLGYYCDPRVWLTGLAVLLIGWPLLGTLADRRAWPLSRCLALAGTAPLLIGLGGYYISEKVMGRTSLALGLAAALALVWFALPPLLRRGGTDARPGRPDPLPVALAFILADAWGMVFLEFIGADFYRRPLAFPAVWAATTAVVLAIAFRPVRRFPRAAALTAAVLFGLLALRLAAIPDRRFVWPDNPNLLAPERRAAVAAARPVQPPPDIIFIVLDTVRAGNVSWCGYPRPTMPRVGAWAARAATNHLHAIAPSTWTVPSHLSMFSGLYPSEHGVDWHVTAGNDVALPPLANGIPLLTEYLGAGGYRTVGICANYAFAFYGRGNSISRGFDRFDCSPRVKIGPLCLAYVAARALFPRSKAWLRLSRDAREVTDRVLAELDAGGDRPLFLFANYMDAHETVWPPEPYRRQFLDRDPPLMLDIPLAADQVTPELQAQLLGLYDASLRYLDDELIRILEHPRAQRALVIVVSDHGQAFGEHGQVYHMNRPYEEIARVPFLVHRPGQAQGMTDTATISTTRIFGSILDAAGVPAPAGRATADLVASQLHNHPDYGKLTSYAVYRDGWKLLRDYPDTDRLFDLGSDPGETASRADSAPQPLSRLRGDLARFTPITELMPDERRSRAFFRSIGYLN